MVRVSGIELILKLERCNMIMLLLKGFLVYSYEVEMSDVENYLHVEQEILYVYKTLLSSRRNCERE